MFGAAGTLAYIVSSVMSARLFATDLRYPFYLLSSVVFVTLVLGVLIAGRQRLRGTASGEARLEAVPTGTGG